MDDATIHITFHGLDASEALEQRIRGEVDRLRDFYPRATACRVVIESPHHHHHKGKLFRVRVDLTVPDDYNRERDLRQNLDQRDKVAFGYDITLGMDLNFSNTVALDGGVRYLKSVSVPQQLGDGTVRIYPQYFQVYVGVGVPFSVLAGWGQNGEGE